MRQSEGFPSRRRQGPDNASSPRPGRKGNRRKHGVLLKAFVATIFFYVTVIAVWQHVQLKNGVLDIAELVSSTKESFLGLGSSSSKGRLGFRSRQTGVADDDWEGAGAIIPYDLSVNFLKLILRAPGAPPSPDIAPSASKSAPLEDFLPIVVPSKISFRWRHRAKSGPQPEQVSKIKAYRVVVRQFGASGKESTAWDSGKVDIKDGDGVPDSVEWEGASLGQIFEWQVQLWDAANNDCSSMWSKFAVGPEEDHDWKGEWIAHPSDMNSFDSNHPSGKRNKDNECDGWNLRRPLPMFRMQLVPQKLLGSPAKQISSALLVVSGLGSFRASFDGVPLSTSGPIDPPFTDYSKRVSYRGFDITPFLFESDESLKEDHVVGIVMGSGWWDHRPISGMAKPELLPRGPATIMAQIFVTYTNGTNGQTHVVGHTGKSEMPVWQVSRGHIRESDLFTGEIVDLDILASMRGWDTPISWKDVTDTEVEANPVKELNKWLKPVPYRTDVTKEARDQMIALKAQAMDKSEAKAYPKPTNFAAPIGKLIPNEIPPVMPMERIAPDEIHDLGSGRWLLDYGKAMSGMVHFESGLPTPIIPDEYPRGHGFKEATANGDSFITLIYGETLEMTTGDINRVIVAGLGLHDGGPRHISKTAEATRDTFCFPPDHDDTLSQRDVYVIPKNSAQGGALFSKARQSHFTTHSFRFAEVCCTAEPPVNAYALLYRTAFSEWGHFDSSNVLINGGYELVRNAMNSNMLSVQSDCPHREKLPYGGDLIADSPSALHMFDMSAFYRKTIFDWMDSQWNNGAYTETSIWQDLNDYAGIGFGAGETVWASAPPVMTVRHMQHYGDEDLLEQSLTNHVRWLDFLEEKFDQAMEQKGYDKELDQYYGDKSGLGDWLTVKSRDTYLTHTAFYMATGRCIAYIARKLGNKEIEQKGMAVAKKIQDRIMYLYLKNGKDNFDFPHGTDFASPGPEMSLFSRIVPGEKRCVVLKNWFRRSGHTWPGDEEMRFIRELSDEDIQTLVYSKELSKSGDHWSMGWSQWQGFNEGIFAIRYALKTLSDMGFHHIALRKATGFGFGTTEYMLRHNATTLWETWWRSEDLYSRNHPMLGATAEWMSSSVAGLSLYPTTTGGRKMLFWPRFPKSASTLIFASAIQGTMKGDFAIAWRFEDLPDNESEFSSAVVNIRIRLLIPPSGEGVFRLPMPVTSPPSAIIRHAVALPDLFNARLKAEKECNNRRAARMGFPFSWEYDKNKKQWYKLMSSKAIGTPCESFLFHSTLDNTKWSSETDISSSMSVNMGEPLKPGFYDILVRGWQLEFEVEGTGRLGSLPEYYKLDNIGPYCNDATTYEWDINDATHII